MASFDEIEVRGHMYWVEWKYGGLFRYLRSSHLCMSLICVLYKGKFIRIGLSINCIVVTVVPEVLGSLIYTFINCVMSNRKRILLFSRITILYCVSHISDNSSSQVKMFIGSNIHMSSPTTV